MVTPALTFAGRLNTGVIEMGRVKANREARVGRRTRLATEDATRCNIVEVKTVELRFKYNRYSHVTLIGVPTLRTEIL